MSDITDDLKPAYAGFLLEEPGEPFKAALRLFADDDNQTGKSLWVAANWPNDPIVMAEMKRLMESGKAEELLPDKTEMLQKVWSWMNGEHRMEDKLKAARLYAEIRDFLPKKDAAPVAVTVAPTVMVVQDFGKDEEWEAALKKQQDNLIQSNNAPIKH